MRMKTSGLLLVAVLMCAGSVMAQNVRQVVKIPLTQVPLAVQQSFEKDFGAIPEDGYWEAFVETAKSGVRTYAKPVWYSYNKRTSKREEKVEVRFSPEGAVTYFTGMKKMNGDAAVDSVAPAPSKKIG